MATRVFAAVDIGASGGRVMAGHVHGEQVELEAKHRFTNRVVEADGHLRWDLTGLYQEVLTGLDRIPEAESIGIDTWGVDYGLLDADGDLLAEPITYRDDRTTKVIDDVHAAVSADELYGINGLQHLPFNTIYQLVAEQRGELWDRAAHAVLLPDLLAFWLTGELRTEVTNASTTGLLDVRPRDWSAPLLDRLHIPVDLLPPVVPSGTIRGTTASGTPVTTVGSHDTASAVVAVPTTTDRFAYIASGTWSLVGIERDAPVLTEAARTAANFTNEAGVDGRTRFLRNESGLWLLQECLREWPHHDRDELLAAAAALPAGGPTVAVDDPSFIPPGRMAERIAMSANRSAMTPVETTRCIVDSLAAAYARTVHEVVRLGRAAVEVVHIVGGGSQNALLGQLTADLSGTPVIAGPVEATALGNVLVQARTHGAVPASLTISSTLVAASTPLQRYLPS